MVVITAGFTYKIVRVEASGFHGREPDEFRWNIDTGRIEPPGFEENFLARVPTYTVG